MPDTLIQSPDPRTLLESLRSTGYTIKTAVADIVDNSITALASHISIQFRGSFRGRKPWIAICDDGCGMNRDELYASMRFGSRGLDAERKGTADLGRFGLGMKIASLSQGRKVTVISWQNGNRNAYCWDLDNITDKWELQRLSTNEIDGIEQLEEIFKNINFSIIPHGTIVLWEKLDRDFMKRDDSFQDAMDSVKTHISLVFHRFMTKEPGYPRVIIFDMNNGLIEPRSPFGPASNQNRFILKGETFISHGFNVRYQPFLLPRSIHYENADEYKLHAGNGGYHHNQGFYVYRNRRLIERATYFHMRRKEFKTQLLRIQLDIPAELDPFWGIDVKKSQLTPPADIQLRVDCIVEAAMKEARMLWDSPKRKVGVQRNNLEPVWKVLQKPQNGQKYSYELNREHEVYKLIHDNLPPAFQKVFREYIRSASDLFPYERYLSDRLQNADEKHEVQMGSEKRLAEFIDTMIEAGMDIIQIRTILCSCETAFPPSMVEKYLTLTQNALS